MKPAIMFKSKYTDQLVTPQNHIAEIILERQNKAITLPKHFWNDLRWKRNYLTQLRLAIQLLKLYSSEAIVVALNTRQGRTIYSLSAKWLDGLIMQEEETLRLKREANLLKTKSEVVKPGDMVYFDNPIAASGTITRPQSSKSVVAKLNI